MSRTVQDVADEAIREPEYVPGIPEAAQEVVVDEAGAKGSWVRRVPLLKVFAAPTEAEIATANAGGTEVGEWSPFEAEGSGLRTDRRAARRGLYAPIAVGAPSTTRQAEILNTALIAAPTGVDGVAAGRDVLSQTAVSKDPVTDYNATPRRVTSTNVLEVGDVGAGKSSYTKCVYVLRPLILRNRRAVVFDKKNERGEGEYAPIVRFYGGEPIRFALDGSGVKLNIMDPAIAGSNDTGHSNTLVYLATIPPLMRNGAQTTARERKALRMAYRAMMRDLEGGRTPTTADLHDRLGLIDTADPSLAGVMGREVDRLHEAGMEMRYVFDELLDTYGPIFEGETSPEVKLNARLTSFDISQLPDTGPGIPMVMGLGNMWLLGRVRRDRGIRTNVVIEEAGHILGTAMAEMQRSNIKLSRGLGISNIYNIHKGNTDVAPGSPGMAVIEEAQTVHVFRQTRPEAAEWCVRTFGLNPETGPEIMTLPNGHHFFKGADPAVPEFEIEHIRSSWEIAMTDTDSALRELAEDLYAS
ncbi:ATP/GTP-binding protein [Sinomonas sp. JGH33]|uniref:ATP/GTP-binding protein n=1 Tax=Sinomonas terricola TaxID=3110330 RepID=A0ABU5TBU5_9MICC|nr:ATP/GTP-binding protein [Sinomonas sp. JGH33]MEA5456959.1 ATP/GTP-binding protein [Sinomonas sp. JGH33]